LFGDLSV